MSKRIVNFNAESWSSIFSFSATAQAVGQSSHLPISPVEASIILESDIVAAYVGTTIPDGRYWTFGGRIVRQFRGGLTIGGGADIASKPDFMYVNKTTVIFFPRVEAEYTLKFYFPRWFKSVILNVWEYTGTDDDLTDITQAQEFANINFKLDQLLNQ